MTDSILGKLHPKLMNIMFVITTSMDKSRCYNAKNSFRKFIRILIYYIFSIFNKSFIDKLLKLPVCLIQGTQIYCTFN